jgi:hypothetical protein
MDNLTKDGAEELAARLRAYWAARDLTIKTWVEPVQDHKCEGGVCWPCARTCPREFRYQPVDTLLDVPTKGRASAPRPRRARDLGRGPRRQRDQHRRIRVVAGGVCARRRQGAAGHPDRAGRPTAASLSAAAAADSDNACNASVSTHMAIWKWLMLALVALGIGGIAGAAALVAAQLIGGI